MGKWLAGLLAAVMVFAAGCQAVQGVDFNKMLMRSLLVESAEGKMSYELEIMLSDELLEGLAASDEDAAALLPLLTNMKLDLHDVKVKDAQTASVAGTLSLGDIGIGFDVRTAGDLAVIELAGAREPIVLELTEEMMNSFMSGFEDGMGAEAMLNPNDLDEAVQAELQEMGKQILDDIGEYAVVNLPNVERLKVDLGQSVTVGPEQLSLARVQAEMNGKEMWTWLNKYLDALIADEDGFKEMLEAIVKTVGDNAELFESMGLPLGDIPTGDEAAAELAEAADEAIAALKEAKAALDAVAAEEQEMLDAIFNEASYAKADFYVDNKLDIRKSNFELVVKPQLPADEDGMNPLEGFEGIRIATSVEQWNVNGDVTPNAPVVPEDGGLTIDELVLMEDYEALRFFDKDSGLYDLLVNRLRLNRQELHMYPEYDEPAPIITPDGRTLVPLRYVAEHFGAEITFDAETNTLELTDGASGTTILMQRGSKDVVVNGETVTWSYPVTYMADGTGYVPARDLIQTLGGTIAWTELYDERVLVMNRKIA